MTALLTKDFYVLRKQMGAFFFIILIFSAIPNTFNNVFAVIYAAMLPYTSIAYDEQSKWDQLAAALPYSRRDLVLSKYALGWLGILGAAGLSLVIQGALRLAVPGAAAGVSLTVVFLAACASVCVLAVTLPLMFRFGVERGRLVMFLIIFLVCGGSGAFSAVAASGDPSAVLGGPLLLALPLAAAVLTAASVPLSARFYDRRRR